MAKKIISVVLALVMAMAISVPAFAKTSEEADRHLQFREDGSFRIMQISDMQDYAPMHFVTKRILRRAIETLDPDLIVLTGDNISSTTLVKGYSTWAIFEFMTVFEKYGVPVVMTFGNHDDENTTANKAFQEKIYDLFPCYAGCAGEDLGDTNLCTFYVPIYSSTDKNEAVSCVWMIDSGTYNTENDRGGYAATTKAQIDWYKTKSAELEQKYGHKLGGYMFQHIIVPEIWDAMDEHAEWVEGSVGHDGKYYTLPEGTNGTLGEGPCPPNYNNGQFDAILERGDINAMFFGHDHTNTFEILDYKGVDLINTAGVGFNSYNSEDAGVRMIILDENDPASYETDMVGYYEMFDINNDLDRYLFEGSSDTVDQNTRIKSSILVIFAFIKQLFTTGFGLFGKVC